MAIRIKARPAESAEQLLRRFKKMCEKEGLTKDLKKKAHYEKPSERRRRAKRKSINRALMLKSGILPGPPNNSRTRSGPPRSSGPSRER